MFKHIIIFCSFLVVGCSFFLADEQPTTEEEKVEDVEEDKEEEEKEESTDTELPVEVKEHADLKEDVQSVELEEPKELTAAENLEMKITDYVTRSCPDLKFHEKISESVKKDVINSLTTRLDVVFPGQPKGSYNINSEDWDTHHIEYPKIEYCGYYTHYWVAVVYRRNKLLNDEEPSLHFFYGWIDEADINEYTLLKRSL